MTSPAFHGLIQHSFALRLSKRYRRLDDAGDFQQVNERFAFPASGGAGFEVRAVCEPAKEDGRSGGEDAADYSEHSPLVRFGRTSVRPLPLSFSGANGDTSDPKLPPAFGWAGKGKGKPDPKQDGPTFIFGRIDPETGRVECNDYLVRRPGDTTEADAISSSLLEILAHKRSRLLGLALANRIFSVMLPHAILTPVAAGGRAATGGPWFVQPLVSIIRDGRVRTELRDSYSLTLLLIPIAPGGFRQRKMTSEEIDLTVNAGWGLATAPTREKPPRFRATGPLLDYLPRLAAPVDLSKLLRSPEASKEDAEGGSITLRQGTEVLAFGLGLRLAQGSVGRAEETMRRIGDDVVTSLGSARVSSVLVVDELTTKDIRRGKGAPPKKHRALMAEISRETRPPDKTAGYRKYRLDRAFVDDKTYVVGVVPTKRCLVVFCAAKEQYGWYQSGLMQAGSLTHMTIGAATAIGTLRAIDRDLEGLDADDPTKIAEIDDEIATDLREIYDLDITSEEYRSLYRLLRKRLGITRDYKALQDKMTTLYRATSTRGEAKAQKRLNQLTVAIGVVSALISVAGIVVAFG